MTRGAGLFLKWVVAPACMAFIGYQWIGPHYAGDARLKGLVQRGKEVVESHALKAEPSPPTTVTEPSTDAKPESSQAPAPKVSVDVKPVAVDAPSEHKPRRRRRRRRRVAPSDEAAPEATPETDRTGPDPASTP